MAREVEARLRLSAVDRTAKAFNAVQARLRAVERQTSAFARSQAVVGRTVAQTEAALLGYAKAMAVLAAGAGFVGVARTTADFETALVGIQKKAGATTEQMAKLGKEARELATSGELAVPLEEILAAYERGAAAGLPLDELREFARLSAMAADAFEMTGEEAGDAASKFKLGLGIPMEEMQRFFDLINALADRGTADEKDIVEFIKDIGQPLKQFGLANDQIAATGATLLNLGMDASVAARMMGTFTNKLLTPEATEKSAAAFAALYGTTDKFVDLLKDDAKGAMVDFLRRLQKLDKFRRAEILTSILGQGFSDEVSRLSGGLDEFLRNLEYAEGKDWFGSLSKSYQLKLGTLSAEWQKLKNQIEELAIDIGMRAMPGLKEGVREVREIIAEIDAGLDNFSRLIDYEEFDKAQAAFAEMGGAVEKLLNIASEGGHIKKFFEDIAEITNDVARGINALADAVRLVKQGFSDPASMFDRPADMPYEDVPDAMKAENGGPIQPPHVAAQIKADRLAREALQREEDVNYVDPDQGIHGALMSDAEPRARIAALLEDRLTRFIAATIPEPGTFWRQSPGTAGFPARPGVIAPNVPAYAALPAGFSLPDAAPTPRGAPWDHRAPTPTPRPDVESAAQQLEDAIATGGRDAGTSIQEGADSLGGAAEIIADRILSALTNGGSQLAQQIHGALAQGVKVSVQGAGGISGLPKGSGRDTGRSMPHAGSRLPYAGL